MKNIIYFIAGTAVGALFALIFAPQSGAELRTKIHDTAEKDWQKVQAEWQVEMEKVHQSLEQIQQTLQKQEEESEESEETTESA
jgi:gas vesicle protein